MIEKTELPVYRYRIKNTGSGSSKFGVCEVCGKHVDTSYMQIEERLYKTPHGELSFTAHMCHILCGHKECLISKRRNEIKDGAIEYDNKCNIIDPDPCGDTRCDECTVGGCPGDSAKIEDARVLR